MSNWKLISLREAAVTLIDCDHRTPPAAETGYPYVAIPQMKEGRIDLSGVRRISPEHFVEWTRKAKPQEHDVVLSRRCNPGESAYVPAGLDFALGQNLVLLRADGLRIFPPFLRWLVRGPAWWEQVGRFINVGAVFDSLKCADVPKFTVPLPPLADQEAIARILGTLDDKIELNRRMNATLEAMARALFQSWFVDFDPVHAKAAGRQPSGMNAVIAALFPAAFDDGAPVVTPNGWSGRSVYDSAIFINGVAFRNVNFSSDGSGLPVVKIAELKDGVSKQTKFTTEQLALKYKIHDGEIMFSWSGSPDTSIDTFLWTGGEGWLNQHIFKVQFHRPEEKLFVYYLLKHLKPTFIEIARNKQTTGLGHVTAQDMKRLQVAFPPKPILKAFQNLVQSIYDRTYTTLTESRTLATLRDTLLLKLLSGELSVATASATVESAS